MFNNRIFRTSEELDFLRGPLLSAYLRFEILIWLSIALLSLLAAGLALVRRGSMPDSAILTLLANAAISGALLAVFVAIWRFKKWGVYLLLLWTLIMVAGLLNGLLYGPADLLLTLALVGLIVARVMVLAFEIRPKWSAFKWGLF